MSPANGTLTMGSIEVLARAAMYTRSQAANAALLLPAGDETRDALTARIFELDQAVDEIHRLLVAGVEKEAPALGHTYQVTEKAGGSRGVQRHAACSCGWVAGWATSIDLDRQHAHAVHVSEMFK